MLRIVLITTAALCAATPVRAETRIDCAQSPVKVTVPGKYTCQDLGVHSGEKTNFQFRRTNVFGMSNERIKLGVQLYQAMCYNCFVHDYVVSDRAKDRIQRFNKTTKSGANWSDMHRIDGSTYSLTFDSDGRHCSGFIHGGGFVKGGYENYVMGYFCPAEGKPVFGDGDLKSLIASISVSAR
jgi:hypothetical protein